MKNSSGQGWKSLFIALGVIIVIAAVIYGFIHNHQRTNPNPKACVNRTFSIGSSGKCVSDGQHLLNWYLNGDNSSDYLEVNGHFSSSMADGLKKIQLAADISPSGKLEPTTWKLLCQESSPERWWTAAAKNAGCPS